MRVGELIERCRRVAFAARAGVELIDHNAIEPGLEAAAALKRVSKTKRAQSCLLNEILGVLFVIGQPKAEPIRRLEHIDQKRFELLIAYLLLRWSGGRRNGVARVRRRPIVRAR